jgi:hypothetical protein
MAIPYHELGNGQRMLAHSGRLTALGMGASSIGKAGSYQLADFVRAIAS